jgi:hypothetical protein
MPLTYTMDLPVACVRLMLHICALVPSRRNLLPGQLTIRLCIRLLCSGSKRIVTTVVNLRSGAASPEGLDEMSVVIFSFRHIH